MRIGIEFAKTGPAKFISHLDLQRAFSRAIRRSGQPVKLSQGFNPHYIVSFASALALGTESESECVEMATTKEVSVETFLAELHKALPPGLRAKRAVRLGDKAPKLMAAVREAEYTVFIQNADLEKINFAVCDIISQTEINAVKMSKGKQKSFNMRSMIISLKLDGDVLRMRLAAAPTGSLKPDYVIDELKKRAGAFSCRIVRTGLFTHVDDKAMDLLTACKSVE